MKEEFTRTALLLGEEALSELASSHVIVFGVGGVGGHAVDALVRAGIGHITIVDNDKVSPSNINRQMIALHSTIGRSKVEVMKERILDINPEAEVIAKEMFFLPETAGEFDFGKYDYVLDCVDTVSAKIAIIERSKKAGTPVVSAMGAGNKLDPSQFRISDISKTEYCPLAKVMRRELKTRGINHVDVCWSPEVPVKPSASDGKPVPGSVSFVPSVCGLIMAGKAVTDLAGV
ncbi:MAG: tRNA threonylcarbamoyladenosine dehydratase [Clostridiales bacterium]|nr:tRNA threonylcarbamoyladenosine dehydratase [Clostridiales bacterium]